MTLAILFVLGALVVPSIVATADRSRVDGAEDSLSAIREAIGLFSEHVGKRPASLRQLVVPITASAVAMPGTDTDICGATYSVGEQARWAGPYLDRALSASGIPLGVGTAENALSVLPDPSGIDYLQIVVQDVLVEDAEALDRRMDGGDGPGSGAFRWDAAAPGFVTARSLIPFPDC